MVDQLSTRPPVGNSPGIISAGLPGGRRLSPGSLIPRVQALAGRELYPSRRSRRVMKASIMGHDVAGGVLFP
ncbi:MAG: hypothetical protein U5P41_15920 [Gammaproteobacteria bacterium]|nr:hypothetical protein [Gammaproteobacteria bacterium]